MKLNDLKADIVVSVSGGIVNGVFGPKGATVLLVDFDNIREGDEPSVCEVDGTPASKDCRDTLKEAIDRLRNARYKSREANQRSASSAT